MEHYGAFHALRRNRPHTRRSAARDPRSQGIPEVQGYRSKAQYRRRLVCVPAGGAAKNRTRVVRRESNRLHRRFQCRLIECNLSLEGPSFPRRFEVSKPSTERHFTATRGTGSTATPGGTATRGG